jgi:hypothetical protein
VLGLTVFNYHEAFFLLAFRSGFCAWPQLAKIESITLYSAYCTGHLVWMACVAHLPSLSLPLPLQVRTYILV